MLAGKHVMISGGGSGVGAELARQFIAAKARVTILGRREAPLQAVADSLGCLALRCDVTDAAALGDAMTMAIEEQGPVQVAVANAGAAASKPFAQMQAADLTAMLDVNLTGVFNLWHAALPGMKAAKWGRMIAVASTAGLKGYPYVSGYVAAKHGVVGLTRALAMELGQSGITVNAICPGFIDTPLLDRSIDMITAKTGKTREGATKSLIAGNPQGRLIEVDEVAATAVWLCSDAARSVNGHALAISGGEI